MPGQSVLDLWWTKWHWDTIFPEYLGFPLPVSFHRCSITRKTDKLIIVVTTVLHSKPQGCGASVASPAGPFVTKKIGKYEEVSPHDRANILSAGQQIQDVLRTAS
jgi:hypothetical protein